MGVSLATVDRLVAQGMPSVTWGRRTRRFLPSNAINWAAGRGESRVSVMKLPSGRWRAQVYDPATGRNVSVSRILGGQGTFTTKTEAKRARELSGPSFAGWLQVAAFTGLRPGELDALRWERIDFQGSRIDVAQQFNAATRKLDTPKNHLRRQAPLTAHARDALEGLAREGEFCFVSLRGDHWTPSSRAYHWKAVRAATGWQHSLYLATRHFAGWYMVNVLEMPSEDVAIALGHQDGGNLVRRLYGHRDNNRALDRIVGAYESAANGGGRQDTKAESHPRRLRSSPPASAQQALFGETYV